MVTEQIKEEVLCPTSQIYETILNLSERESLIISSIQEKVYLELKEHRFYFNNALTPKEIKIFDYYNSVVFKVDHLKDLLSKF